MITAVPSPLVQDYWAPLSQIIPVLALALILEARRFASQWTVRRRFDRLVGGLVLFVGGALAVFIELTALRTLQSGESNPTAASLTLFATMVLILGVIMLPVIEVATSSTNDVGYLFAKLAVGQFARKLRAGLEENRQTLLKSIEAGDQRYDQVEARRREAKKTKARSSKELKRLEAALEEARQDNYWPSSLAHTKSAEAPRAALVQAKRTIRKANEELTILSFDIGNERRILATVEDYLEESKRRRLSKSEIEEVEATWRSFSK